MCHEALSACPLRAPRFVAGCAKALTQQQAVTCQLAASCFLEHGEQVFDGQVGFFFAADVEEDVPVVHHDQAVAEAQGVAHVVGDHQGGQLLLADDALGQSEDFFGRLRVEGGCVLVE